MARHLSRKCYHKLGVLQIFCQSQKKSLHLGFSKYANELEKSTKILQFILVNHSVTFNLPPQTRLKHRFTVAVKPNQLLLLHFTVRIRR